MSLFLRCKHTTSIMLDRFPSLHRKRRCSVAEVCSAKNSSLYKGRAIMKDCLTAVGVANSIDDRGVFKFQSEGFLISVEVPPDSNIFFMYTGVILCSASASVSILRKAMSLNYLTQETNGCTLALDPHHEGMGSDLQIVLSFKQSIAAVGPSNFARILKSFVRTATSTRKKLERVEKPQSHLSRRASTTILPEKKMNSCAIPPPPPTTADPIQLDATPVISNKSTERRAIPGDAPARKPTRRPVPLKENRKMSMPLSLALSGVYKVPVGTDTHHETKQEELPLGSSMPGRRTSHMIRSLSRMASTTIALPRAALTRPRPDDTLTDKL